MKVVAYCRVSTDDLGQDPQRQAELIRGWAKANNIEVAAVVLDEGTSGSVSPFSRPKVKEAVRIAKEQACDGLVVETADRWTRAGVEDGVMTRAALMQEHRLKLFMVDVPFGWDKMFQDIMLAIRDAMAEDWLRRHRARVSQGLRRAKEKGWPEGRPGRPPKEPLNLEERQMVLGLIESGKGSRTIAHAVSEGRGAFSVADPAVRKDRSVSEVWVRRQVADWCNETPAVLARVVARWPSAVRRNKDVPTQEGKA